MLHLLVHGAVSATCCTFTRRQARQRLLKAALVRLVEHRSFRLQDHFALPQRAPLRHHYCAARELTRWPSSVVSEHTQRVHRLLGTNETTDTSCCISSAVQHRMLVGVHVRTMWADVAARASEDEDAGSGHAQAQGKPSHRLSARLTAAAVSRSRDAANALVTARAMAAARAAASAARDEVHSLFIAPRVVRALGVPVRASPTLASLADVIITQARRHLGHRAPISIFVNARSPG